MVNRLATREFPPESERTPRHEAVRSLAAELVRVDGQKDREGATLSWDNGERAFILSTVSPTGTVSDAPWLYVSRTEGEHDAYSLVEGHDLAPDATTLEAFSDALAAHATERVFGLAQERLQNATDGQLRLWFKDWDLQLRDFTAAEHESFMWLSGRYRGGDTIGYDMTMTALTPSDGAGPAQPVAIYEPQEMHLAWVLKVLGGGKATRQSSYSHYRGYQGRTEHIAISDPDSPSAINTLVARDVSDMLRRIQDLTPSESLHIVTVPEMILKTVIEVTRYGHTTQAGSNRQKAVGLTYNGDVLQIEAFSTATPDSDRIALFMDFNGMTAFGSLIKEGVKVDLRGPDATCYVSNLTDALLVADLKGEFQACTSDLNAHFTHPKIRASTTEDTVQ